MNQSEFLAFSCNLFEAQHKSHAQGAIGFGFATHRMKNWRLKHLVRLFISLTFLQMFGCARLFLLW